MTARRDDDADGLDDDAPGEWISVRRLISEARDSGFDEEPAPRIDALLMAAARQHAPKPRGSWWERLADRMRPMFAHPALAGAAALVIVGGAAGVMYRRGQHRVVSPPPPIEARAAHESVTRETEPPLPPPSSLEARNVPDEVMAPEVPIAPVEPRRRRPIGTRPGEAGRDTRGVAPTDGAGRAAKVDAPLQIAEGPMVATGEELTKNQDDDARAPSLTDSGGTFSAPRAGTPPPPPPRPDALQDSDRVGAASASTTSRTDTDRERSEKQRAQATQLLGQARTAARAQNCAVVKVIATRVRKLDEAYYRDVFSRDPDVTRCR